MNFIQDSWEDPPGSIVSCEGDFFDKLAVDSCHIEFALKIIGFTYDYTIVLREIVIFWI